MTQEDDITFEFCSEPHGKTINIYIHGYSAVKDKKEKEYLKNQIPPRTKEVTNIFSFWPSEHIISGRLGDIALSAASLSPISAIANIAKNGYEHFQEIQGRIRFISRSFIYELIDFIEDSEIHASRVNLIGHSLGARLIIESILKKPKVARRAKIHSLVFLGGARHITKEECQEILKSIDGEIFNIHSNSDIVLRIKPDLEKCIGRHPIEFSEENAAPQAPDRVKNIAFDWLGHMDYWENIGGIINYINLDGVSHSKLERSAPPKADFLDKAEKFATQDKLLFQVIAHATTEERLLLSKVISSKRSASITPEETCPLKITREIQLMGGDSIANKARGHGVRYSEIVRDAAERLKLSDIDKYGTIYLEKLILENTFETAIKNLNSAEQKELNDAINLALDKPENFGAISAKISILSTASLGAVAGFLGSRVATSAIPLVGTAIGISSLVGAGVSAFSGPAFSVTIPLITLIHALRMKTLRDFGNSFLFET